MTAPTSAARPGAAQRPHALPATAAQQGMWFAQSLAADPAALVTGECVQIAGRIDPGTFTRALHLVAREADALQMNLVTDGDRVMQEPQELTGFPVQVVDLRSSPDPEQAAWAWLEQDLTVPFGLGAGLLFRHALLHVHSDRWWWRSAVHHAVTDGYSASMLRRRTAEVYTQLRRGEAPSATPFNPLRSVVDEDADYWSGPDSLTDQAYWRDALPEEDCATLSERSALPASRPLRVTEEVDGATYRALRERARSWSVDWPDLVAAAHALYLSFATGRSDVVLGLPLMNRLGSAGVRTPAMMMNVVPLPVTVDPAQPVAALAGGVAEAARSARRHGRYRLENIRRDRRSIGAERAVVGPLVNVLPAEFPITFDGLACSVHHVATGPVDDLTITVVAGDPDEPLRVLAEANPERYRTDEVDAHLRRILQTLDRVAHADDGTPAGSVDVVPAHERALLDSFNDTAIDLPVTPLTAPFHERATAHVDRPAVTDENQSLTYGQLAARVDDAARALADRGVGPGSLVAVSLPRSIDLIVAVHAVLLTGAAYVPIDPDYPQARRDLLVDDADPALVITEAGAPAGARDQVTVDHLVGAGAALPPQTWAETDPDSPAYVIFTSGSTGRPKGVVVSHRAIDNRLRWMQHHTPLGPADVVLQKTPIGFDVSVWELFWALREGARLVLARPGGHQEPAYLREVIQREGVTVCHFVPSMLRAFLDDGDPLQDSALRVVFCSGEALPEHAATDMRRAYPTVRLVNLYGPTEAAVDVTCQDVDTVEGPVPIGAPIWNTTCHVLSATGQECPPGVAGELHLGGVQVADGYLHRPELTAERFLPDPRRPGGRLYRTGDRARWRADGVLEYLGRLDDQVKVHGQRLEPGEIEAVLRSQDGVRDAAVIVREDQPGHQLLVGYVCGDVSTAALHQDLGELLPHHMVPGRLVALDRMPLSPNGKLDRKQLPAPARELGNVTPCSPAEHVVIAAYEEVLQVDGIGADANFFDLGGTSLHLGPLARALRSRLGLDLTMGALFRAPTPRALALHAAADTTEDLAAVDSLIALRSGGDRPALFAVHPAGGLSWCYAGLLRRLGPDQPVYGLQADGLLPGTSPAPSMETMARVYADRIVEVQPEGPYRLLGWSVGGGIAHAIAGALQARGHHVDLLAMMDAYPADQWRDQRAPSEAETWKALLRMAGLEDRGDLTTGQILDLLRGEGSTLAALPDEVIARVAPVVRNNAILMRRQHHGVVDCDLTFFLADAPREENWLTPTAWEPYVKSLDCHRIPATHAELIRPDNLDTISASLRAEIDRLER